jgi:hypothetical protein
VENLEVAKNDLHPSLEEKILTEEVELVIFIILIF